MKSIVILSGVRYQSTKQRPQHMVDYFASEGYRVYYFSLNGQKKEIPKEKFEMMSFSEIIRNNSKQIKDNVYEVDKIFSAESSYTDLLLNKLNVQNKLTIIVSHPDWMRELNNLSSDITLIYDCMDDWEEFVYSLNWGWNNSTIYFERKLASIADLVICSSKRLSIKMLNYNDKILYIPNGVNNSDYQEKFTQVARPMDMQGIESPIIFFMGAIAGWVDIELINYLAEKRPSYNFVFVGEEVKEKLPTKNNIYMLGKKKYKDLKNYLLHSNITIIPFKENNLTASVTPLKFYEYISAGKPVVTTMLPDLIGLKGVGVADDREDFLVKIDKFLQVDTEEISLRNRELSKGFEWGILIKPLKLYIETKTFRQDSNNLIRNSIDLYKKHENRLIKNELTSLYNAASEYGKSTEIFKWHEIKNGVKGIDYNQIAYAYLMTGDIEKAELALWNHLSMNKHLENYIPFLKKLLQREQLKERYLTIYILKFSYRFFEALKYVEEYLKDSPLKSGISATIYFEIGEKEIGMQLALEAINYKSDWEISDLMDVYTIENVIDYFIYQENYEDAEYLAFKIMAYGFKENSTKMLSKIYYSSYSE
ncbi:glycosyltransferase [Lysinibacillus sphaericus]